MTANIGVDAGEFKAVGALSISATAKYVGTIMMVTGITSATEICAITGLPRSTVYRAQAEFYEHGGTSLSCLTRPTSEIPTCPTDEKDDEKTVSLVPPVRQNPDDAPRAPASMTPRATKELPSEVSSIEVKLDSPSSVPPKLKTKGTRLPNDWQLPNDWRQWTRQRFVHSDDAMVSEVAEQFRDFWIAKTGSAATKLDWQATWRNWCRNDKTLTGIARPRPINGGRLAFDESNARRLTAREASVEHAKAELARLDAMYAS